MVLVLLTGLLACDEPVAEPLDLSLPPAFMTNFEGDDIPFDNAELSLLSVPTRSAFEQYYARAPHYEEYSALLDGGATLTANAPSIRVALGAGWEEDRDFSVRTSGEAISFLEDKTGERITFLAVASSNGGAGPQPVRILSSQPIRGLD